jgi:superoxide reductase
MTPKEECPQCEDDLFCGVNMAEQRDPEQMSALEKKHVPVISAPDTVNKGECFEVTIEVGKYKDHPNEPGHFIEFLELYADDTFLARVDLTHTKTCPVAKVCVSLDHVHKELRAFEHCNLHGTWEWDAPLEVRE